MNILDETDRNRLSRALEHSYRGLEGFRNLNQRLVEEYSGSGYGSEKVRPRYETLINLMNQAVDAYTMSLVANRPRVLVTTKLPKLRGFARHYQVAINNLIEEIHLEETLRQAVLDAFFCIGIVKVHMADSVPVMLEEGFWADPGTPFASNISIDNFVYDTTATRWDRIKFAGDAYRLPFDDLKDSIFDQAVVEGLQPGTKFSDEGDRLEKIARGDDVDSDELEPMIDVADIWVPREKKIYTFAIEQNFRIKGKPLAEMDAPDPEFGYYRTLTFNDVPENIMPTSPASHLSGLARLANNLLRKQGRKAKGQKDLFTYTSAGAKDANRVKNSDDQEVLLVDDPTTMQVMKMGGVDPQNQAFLVSVIQTFDRVAGNLPAMLGLGPSAATVGQEQLIQGAVSKKEAQMQYRATDFAVRIIRDLARLLWDDRMKVIPGELKIEGVDGYSVDSTWTPEDREGMFDAYGINVDLNSMPYQSSASRVQAINALLTQVYAPLAPMMMQQGGRVNLQKLTEIYADLMNEPRLKDIFEFTGSPEEPQEQPGMASATTRNYVRRSVPTSGTADARANVEQSQWLNMAGQANPDQMAMMNRG